MQGQMGKTALKDLRPSTIKWLLSDSLLKSFGLFIYLVSFIICEFTNANGYQIAISL